MAQDANELLVASNGDVYSAPVGTTLPADTSARAALHADFVSVGLINEEGVSPAITPEIQGFRSWQRTQDVRRERISQAIAISFSLQQWNVENLPFAFGGGSVVETAAGVFKYTYPEDNEALDERILVLDWEDGDKLYRAVYERGNVAGEVSTTLNRSSLSEFPVTFEVLSPADGDTPGFIIADDTAFSSVS